MSIIFIMGASALLEGFVEFVSDLHTHIYMRTHTKRRVRAWF